MSVKRDRRGFLIVKPCAKHLRPEAFCLHCVPTGIRRQSLREFYRLAPVRHVPGQMRLPGEWGE